MEHAKHIIRAVLLVILIVVVFIFMRHFAIPESHGRYGSYRFDSVAEHMAQPPVHGAPGGCVECHEEEAEIVSNGTHGTVSCEVCHAPYDKHVQDDEWVAEMPVDRSNAICGRCHERLVARPTEFPQVVIRDHLTEVEAEFSEEVCQECHNAHNPSE